MRTKVKMVWVDAARYIAFMKNMRAFINEPVMELVRNAVSVPKFALDIKYTVAEFVAIACPQMATRFGNRQYFIEEPFTGVLFLTSHMKSIA